MVEVRACPSDPLFPESLSFQAYELHSFACDPPEGWVVTAVSEGCIQAVRHPDRPLSGVMFHPEVRNDDVLARFLSLCREKDTGYGSGRP